MPETNFVEAYSKTTGRMQRIPKHWLGLNFPPFDDFQKSEPKQDPKPAAKSADSKEAK